MLLTEVATVDEVLAAHAPALGGDLTAYRNHVYRVVNFCVALAPSPAAQLGKVAVAAVYHDLGIWTAGTFDYLRPSMQLAAAHLARTGRPDWSDEVETMILEHHKILPSRSRPDWLVEPFRQADWVDVSRGLFTFGLPRAFLSQVFSVWPNAGFHRRLVALSLKRLRTHPLSPLPMVRL